jgi:hypothetical protein
MFPVLPKHITNRQIFLPQPYTYRNIRHCLSRDFTALVGENMLKVSPQRGAKRNWNVLMKKSSFRIPRAVAPVQCHEAPSHVDSARATAATCLRVSF